MPETAEEIAHFERTGENPAQRSNRQLAELLQEMRVVQVGGQILFAFLLAIPFQPTFEHIGSAERTLYTVSVVLTVTAMFLLMTPVALHRAWFRAGMKEKIIRYATWMTGAGLALLGPGILCAVTLVLSVAMNWWGAIAVAVVLAFFLLWLWVLLPAQGHREAARGDKD
ncbi:hypothetical protein D1871_01725 [Nakamurella silvestris]|nr:hypothetical protein D1871_01725 [Nakamurella silvestris]